MPTLTNISAKIWHRYSVSSPNFINWTCRLWEITTIQQTRVTTLPAGRGDYITLAKS